MLAPLQRRIGELSGLPAEQARMPLVLAFDGSGNARRPNRALADGRKHPRAPPHQSRDRVASSGVNSCGRPRIMTWW